MSSALFSPLHLRGLELTNRIVVSPMCQYAAIDGSATDWHVMHLGGFAVSGSGLVITEATAVSREGRITRECLGLYSDENEAALARIVRFFRDYGGTTKLGVQLAHAGLKASVLPSFVERRALRPEEGAWTPLAPSPHADGTHLEPHVLTAEDILRVREEWTTAIRRCERLGVDLVELHFAHGYLVNEFLSPLTNHRSDAYGGSRVDRMRLALQIFEDCRALWPEEKPLGVRLSAVDWVEHGWQIEDSVALAQELQARGCDYICASSGGVSRAQNIKTGPGYQVGFAARIRRDANIPVIAVGEISAVDQAEEVLSTGQADLIAIARGMLYNPRWTWHAATALNEFVTYPPRYRAAHPFMGSTSTFSESAEWKAALKRTTEREAMTRQDSSE